MRLGRLSNVLYKDSQDFYQAAVVTFVDALRSVDSGFYSWATIKLYYSVFYAVRSRLAFEGDCIFYVVKSPKVLSARAGDSARNLRGTTHKAVLSHFRTAHSGSYFLSQDIGGQSPFEWFANHRERTNYTIARFSEPEAPGHFSFAISTTRRQMLSAYVSDDVYVFDEDHAIIAFPFKLLRELRDRLLQRGIAPLVPVEIDFLRKQMKDRAGPLVSLNQVLS